MKRRQIIKTDWARVDAMAEEEIDTSDIPPITEESFRNSKWWKTLTKERASEALNVLVSGERNK
jgi:hypothetical protein